MSKFWYQIIKSLLNINLLIKKSLSKFRITLHSFDNINKSLKNNCQSLGHNTLLPLLDQLLSLLIIKLKNITGQQRHTFTRQRTQILIIRHPAIKIISPTITFRLVSKCSDLFLVCFAVFEYLLVHLMLAIIGQIYAEDFVILFY